MIGPGIPVIPGADPDIEVEVTILIHIAPAGAVHRAVVHDARTDRHIGEGEVAIVAVQAAVGITPADEDIEITIIVVVSRGHARSHRDIGETRADASIGEVPRTIVFEEAEVPPAAMGDDGIEIAIPVKVGQNHPGAVLQVVKTHVEVQTPRQCFIAEVQRLTQRRQGAGRNGQHGDQYRTHVRSSPISQPISNPI